MASVASVAVGPGLSGVVVGMSDGIGTLCHVRGPGVAAWRNKVGRRDRFGLAPVLCYLSSRTGYRLAAGDGTRMWLSW